MGSACLDYSAHLLTTVHSYLYISVTSSFQVKLKTALKFHCCLWVYIAFLSSVLIYNVLFHFQQSWVDGKRYARRVC